MEKIKFRALTAGSGEWVIGDLIHLDKEILIAGEGMPSGKFVNGHIDLQAISIYPPSIGQFTGLNDKNGVEIYSGDIVKEIVTRYDFDKPDGEDEYEEVRISTVEYTGHGFWIKDEYFGWEGEGLWNWENLEVIGDIHQHPHLLNS